jgi:hypothetical protein
MAAAHSELVADAMLEDQLADIWPEYPCVYDVRSQDFKNRDMRENMFAEIAKKLGQSSKSQTHLFHLIW